MTKNLKDAIKDRCSYYQLQNNSPISDKEIQSIVEHVILLSIRKQIEWWFYWGRITP
jgi:predicted oxidoreductase (fatty acid repression mutant protein)